jgi:hypothetical protein
MTRFTTSLFLVLVAGASACSSDIQDEPTPDNNVPGGATTSGSEDTTYDHDNDGKSPWEVLAERQAAGPLRYQSRVHGCVKVRYSTVGNMLASRGVSTGGTAGTLFTSGMNSMGAPVYDSRVRENLVPSTAGMSRLFDIFTSAVAKILTNFPNVEACKVGGAAVPLFDGGGATCNTEAFSCLLGAPASAAHIDICNKTIAGAKNAAGAPDQAIGQRLAVAVMLAAAHTCE